ncbi:MAG: hypothetical protein ACRDIE_13690 [Chloroflexota bacterium]
MGTVNTWVGAIGGTILVLELIVLLILLIALNVVLALVLRWVLRKQNMVHEKIEWARALVERYVNKGAGLAAAPVIRTTSTWRGAKTAAYRALHWPTRVRSRPAMVEKQPVTDTSRAA